MLNNDYRQQVETDLRNIENKYSATFKKTITSMKRLQDSRKMAIQTIKQVERYIIALANKPRDYETKMGEIQMRYIEFETSYGKIQKDTGQVSNVGMAGTLGGAAIALMGQETMMAVAMTFGTASTGTAIASLSGAAATNAALSWLAGGSLATGGAGAIVGQTMPRLLGPIGLLISGVSLTASLMQINKSNKEIAENAEKSITAIKKEIERIKEINVQVLSWNKQTIALSTAITSHLKRISSKHDCNTFSDDDMNELISLFNSTEVLSKLIGKTIKGEK